MFIPATKYITEGFAIYLTAIKQADNMQIKITYSDINPLLEWVKCNNPLLIYDEESIITSTEPRIIPINYKIVKGYYTVDISYKNGLYVVDNQTITIGLTKGEKQVHINFPQSAYKLI
jgi:hypothetical protein